MASLSRVNVQVGFQGSEALAGMKQLEGEAKKLEKASDSLSKSGGPRSMGQSWADFKAKFDLATGATQGLIQFTQGILELGSSMQSLQIRTAYLAGSWEEAGQALGRLQVLAVDSGISFGELTAGIQKLTTSGLSLKSAVTLMEGFARGAEIMGQGGMETMAGATQALLRSATASESVLQQLQDKGLDVYKSLGEELSKLTGRAYTTEEAIRAIRRGAVSSAMALEAMQAAGNSPEAMQAQARFFGSFEGQMARIRTTWEELTRDLSRMLLESFNFEQIAAGARGSLSAVRDIVKEIADTFLPVVDPKNKAEGAEKAFRTMRDITYEIAESIAKAAKQFQWAMEDAAANLGHMANKVQIIMREGASGQITGKTSRLLREADIAHDVKMGGLMDPGRVHERYGYLDDITQFFNKIKEKAGQKDLLRDAELQAAAQGKGAAAAKNAAKAAEEQAASMEAARKTAEKMALDLEEKFATPLEQFDRKLADVQTRLLDARKKLGQGVVLDRIEAGLEREAGGLIMDLLKNNATGTSWQAARVERGSSAAVEAMLRNQLGDQGKNVQERIKAALDRANELAKAQLLAQQQAVEAFKQAQPGVIAF